MSQRKHVVVLEDEEKVANSKSLDSNMYKLFLKIKNYAKQLNCNKTL